jgi:hypothetical protein
LKESLAEHIARTSAIGGDFRIRNAGQVIMPKRDEGIGDELSLRRARRLVGMAVGDPAEVVEGPQIIARHAIAIGIPAVELLLRHQLSLIGGILQRSVLALPGIVSGGGALARNPSPGAEAAALGVTEAVLEAIGTCRSVTALMSHSGSVAPMGFFHNLIVHAL